MINTGRLLLNYFIEKEVCRDPCPMPPDPDNPGFDGDDSVIPLPVNDKIPPPWGVEHDLPQNAPSDALAVQTHPGFFASTRLFGVKGVGIERTQSHIRVRTAHRIGRESYKEADERVVNWCYAVQDTASNLLGYEFPTGEICMEAVVGGVSRWDREVVSAGRPIYAFSLSVGIRRQIENG